MLSGWVCISGLKSKNQEIELIFNFQVLGMGEKWLGGDMNYPGGGFKVNLLKKELEEMVKASEASADRYS